MTKTTKILPLFILLISAPSLAAIHLTPIQNGKGNLILEKDPKTLVSSLYLVIKTGSAHDPKGKAGLTKLSFDSLLRGTKHRSKDEFFAEVEQLGATLSVHTSYNHTTLYLSVISKNLEPAIQLLAEALLQPSLRKKQINRLLREHKAKLLEARSDIRSLLGRATRRYLYKETSLENHYEGTIPSIKNIRLKTIKNHLRININSSNIIFAVSSNHKEEDIKTWIKKYFAQLPKGMPSTPLTLSNFKKRAGRHFLILPNVGAKTVNVIVTPLQLGPQADFPKWHILSLGSLAFGRGMSSILFNELREKTGWTYTAYGAYSIFDLPRSYGSNFVIFTAPASIYAEKAIPRALELFKNYVNNGVTKNQFDLAAEAIKGSYAFKFAQAKQRLNNRIYSAIDGKKIDSLDLFRKKIDYLKPSDLKNLLQQIHSTENMLIAVTGEPKKMKQLIAKTFPGKKTVVVAADPITN